MANPRFVSLEGIDKTGKSLISDLLEAEYPEFRYVTDPTKIEPWGALFENGTRQKIPGIVDSFQFFSARLHCYQELIKPALEANIPVVADRYSDSWFAYQAVFQAEFFDSDADPIKYFERIHELSVEYGLLETPDLTILILIDKDTIRRRLDLTDDPTEFEESVEKQWKVHNRYQELLGRKSDRMREVEDHGQGITELYRDVANILEQEGFL